MFSPPNTSSSFLILLFLIVVGVGISTIDFSNEGITQALVCIFLTDTVIFVPPISFRR